MSLILITVSRTLYLNSRPLSNFAMIGNSLFSSSDDKLNDDEKGFELWLLELLDECLLLEWDEESGIGGGSYHECSKKKTLMQRGCKKVFFNWVINQPCNQKS